MRRSSLCSLALFFAALALPLPGAADDAARKYVAAAMAALGGAAKLEGITALEYRAVGTRIMVEQSERPSGPYFIDHFRVHEIRDLAHGGARIEEAHEGYNADKWWLQQTEPLSATTILNDDVAVRVAGDKFAYAGGSTVQQNQEQFAFAPERLLQTAAAAADLRFNGDVTLHGVRHHQLAFTWRGAPCVLEIGAATNLPWSIRWTRAYPYQTFLNPWGDVTTTLTFNAWTLEPYGIVYPREWTFERVGLPDTQFAIVALTINPTFDAAALRVPADIYAAHHAKLRAVDAVPFGTAGSTAPRQLAEGIVFYPGGWNVSFVKQDRDLIMIEAPWSGGYTQQALDEARKRFGVPVTAVITTSDSWPHIAGVRQAVARGITVYALDLNVPILRRLVRAPHRQHPDLLARHPLAPRFRIVAGDTFVGSGPNRLEIVPYRTATGERQMMVYFPGRRLLYTSDLFSDDGRGGWFTPEYLREMIGVVTRERLDPTTIFGMHYDPTAYRDVVEYLNRFVSPPAAPAPTPSAVSPAHAASAAEALTSLGFFAGTWSCKGYFPSNGQTIASTMRFESDLGGTILLKHHDDVQPALYHALETWGFDAASQQFAAGISDNFGGVRRFGSDGWHGDVFTWTSAPEIKPLQQFEYTKLPGGGVRVDWRVAKDGTTYVVGDTLACSKT